MPITCQYRALQTDQAAALMLEPSGLPALIEAKDSAGVSYFWHGLEYLLKGVDAPEAAFCFRTGGQVLPSGAGLPESRLHSASEVKQILAAIASICESALDPEGLEFDLDQLGEEYDAEAMDAAGVYPNKWVELENEDDAEYGEMIELMNELCTALQDAAAADQAMLFYFEQREDERGF